MKKILFFVATAIALTACNSGGKVKLSGAGATFPAPFYNVIFKKYTEVSSNSVTYGGVGSGGGIRSLQDKTVDFGATDVFLSDSELAEMGAEVVHIPTVMGAVVLSYNLPEISNLKLTSGLISEIYTKKITKWNDPKIKAVNPDITLPDLDITPVYRSDGSGTTAVFSDYMSKTDGVWKQTVGTGKQLKFPAGVAAKGNPGVAGIISGTQGAIGYIGSEYALALKLTSALLQNSSGKFVEANTETISLAAEIEIPNDTRVVLTNSSNPDAYPIATFTWLILYKEQNYNNRTLEQATALQDLLNYITDKQGQEIAAVTFYAPLSSATLEKTKAAIKSLTYNGESIPEKPAE